MEDSKSEEDPKLLPFVALMLFMAVVTFFAGDWLFSIGFFFLAVVMIVEPNKMSENDEEK